MIETVIRLVTNVHSLLLPTHSLRLTGFPTTFFAKNDIISRISELVYGNDIDVLVRIDDNPSAKSTTGGFPNKTSK